MLVSLAGMVYTEAFVQREFGEVIPDQGFMWDEPSCPLSQIYVDDLIQIGDTLSAAGELRMPWLLLHGMDDDVVLPSDSMDLEKILRGPCNLVKIDGAGHSFEGYYNELIKGIDEWLEKYL